MIMVRCTVIEEEGRLVLLCGISVACSHWNVVQATVEIYAVPVDAPDWHHKLRDALDSVDALLAEKQRCICDIIVAARALPAQVTPQAISALLRIHCGVRSHSTY